MADWKDVTPAGIAGGQGHSAQDVEDSTLIGGVCVALCLGAVAIAALVHWISGLLGMGG